MPQVFTGFDEKTLNDMLFERVQRWPQVVATRRKVKGEWVATTWQQMGELVASLGIGLRSIGLREGRPVAIMMNTRWEWALTDLAIVTAGGITVGVYTTLAPEQGAYIIGHSEASIVIVENRDMYRKVEAVAAKLPRVGRIVVVDPEGVPVDHQAILTWEDLLERGRKASAEARAAYEEHQKHGNGESVVTYIYTSGTTGPPKGAMLCHRNFLHATRFYTSVMGIGQGESTLSFLPLAHALQRTIDYLAWYAGATINYARAIETVREDIQDAKPSAMGSVPRIFEKIYAGVLQKAQQEPPVKRKIFQWAIGVGRERSRLMQRKKRLPILLLLQYAIARKLVFDKIREALGGRIRLFGSGGAPISVAIQEFFHSCGIMILEAWGLTETTALGTVTRPDDFKFGTVGKPATNVEIRIAPDGEILLKGPCVFLGYYKDEARTAEAFDGEWFLTGDVGIIDEDGFLKITDRKKDLIITAYGKNIAPQNIENLLKESRYISQAMSYGDKQKYLVALVTLDLVEVEPWAKAHGVSYETPEQLAAHPEVAKLIQNEVDSVNKKMASYEAVRRFDVVPQDFTVEGGEITPTLKVKRKVVFEKYGDRIRKLYGEDWTD